MLACRVFSCTEDSLLQLAKKGRAASDRHKRTLPTRVYAECSRAVWVALLVEIDDMLFSGVGGVIFDPS